MILAIVFLVERFSGSARIAGLAAFMYAANPNFLYWSAQFSYESLALPLVLFALFLTVQRADHGPSPRLTGLVLLAILAVVVSHHLSSYFLAGILVVWSLIAFWRARRDAESAFNPYGLALFTCAAIALWLGTVASITGQYLGGIASSTGSGLYNVITGASPTRKLFTSGAEVAPSWERGLGILAVLITLVGLGYGGRFVWKQRARHPLMLCALALAALYPLLLPLRFVGSAAETANRSTEFLSLGLGAVLAACGVSLMSRPLGGWRVPTLAVALLAGVVVAGGVAVSWQYSERLPEDPAKQGVPHEVTLNTLSAYQWTATRLGAGRRFATDFLDELGLAGDVLQRPLYGPVDDVRNWQVMAPSAVDKSVRAAIAAGHVEFVLVNRRLGNGIPTSGFYFDKGEPGAEDYKRPLSARVLRKFDKVRGASRIYDNGTIQIYAVSALR